MDRYTSDPRWQLIYEALFDYTKVAPEEMTIDILDVLDRFDAPKVTTRKRRT